MTSQQRGLQIALQGRRRIVLWIVPGMLTLAKAFLPYYLYRLAQKTYRRLALAPTREAMRGEVIGGEVIGGEVIGGEAIGGEEESSTDEGMGGETEEKKNFSIFEEAVPDLEENRRIVSLGGSKTFVFYLRLLRDSFPNDDRFQFGWGGFQANGSQSLFLVPDGLKKAKLLFTMENPVIGRSYFDRTETRDKGYFRIALYDSTMFQRGVFNLPHQANATRLHTIMKTTNSSILPYRKRGNHILYALQVPHDRSLVGLDIFTAAQYDLVTLRRHTSRKIIVSVNPAMIRELWAAERLKDEVAKSYGHLQDLCHSLDIDIYDNFQEQGKDSSQFFKDCWCVVCHSSGVAVDALMAGVPAITLHPASFVYPICSHELSEVENPKMADRIAWFSRLAYCQWTLAEIENFEVWRHFQPSIERLLEKRL